MKKILPLLLFIPFASCSQSASQENKPTASDKKVDTRCEICDGIYESPVAFSQLNERDTLSCFNEPGPKLYISGIVYKNDGKTPAGNVVLYFYQTDQTGVYPKRGGEKGYAREHGYLRGWLRTNSKGEYHIYTLRPGSYPNSRNPAHIHIVVKEPGIQPYWIEDFLFEDDPYLAGSGENSRKPRGGSGVLSPVKKDGLLVAIRDIYLGRNVY